ncbi:unnamed protein product [Alopecurus aequalis]
MAETKSSLTSSEITRSRRITDVTATVHYKLTNYLQLKGMGVGKFVSSRVFRVAGYDWEIRFYPAGATSDFAGNASCYLSYLSQAKDVSTKFTLSMMETNGQEQVASNGTEEADYKFKPLRPVNECGYGKFADRSKLELISRVGDGCFTIGCVLTVRNESPPLELPGHLERMLGDPRGADVTFNVGGEEFCANKFLLAARSPIFAAQLFGPMADKDMRHVEVIDMEPTIFEMMRYYIYTDSLPPCSDHGGAYSNPEMQHLLVAADRYGLDRLKQMCEEELCKRMDVETVTTTLALADQHQCKRLKEACIGFMASSTEVMAAVAETIGFKEHLKTCSRPLSLEESPKEKRQPSM